MFKFRFFLLSLTAFLKLVNAEPIEQLVAFFDSGLTIKRENPECPRNRPEHRLVKHGGTDLSRHVATNDDPGQAWNRTYTAGGPSGTTVPDPSTDSSRVPSCCMVQAAIKIDGENGLRPHEILDNAGLNEESMSFGQFSWSHDNAHSRYAFFLNPNKLYITNALTRDQGRWPQHAVVRVYHQLRVRRGSGDTRRS